MGATRLIDRNLDPQYFEIASCSECGSIEDLLKHKFSDEVTCTCCVNKAVEVLVKQNKIDEEFNYPDENEALTLAQRNT